MTWKNILKSTSKGRRGQRIIRAALRPVIQEMVENFAEDKNEIRRDEIIDFINSNAEELKNILYIKQRAGPNQDPSLQGISRQQLGNNFKNGLKGLHNIAIYKLRDMGYEIEEKRDGKKTLTTFYVLRDWYV